MSLFRSLTVLDILFTVLLLLFLIHGIRRGLIRSLFSLLALAAGWVVASHFHVALAARWTVSKPEAEVALRLGVFILLFLLTGLVVRLIGQALTGMVEGSPLGLINRLLGGVCGVGVASVFLGVLFLVTSAYFPGSAGAIASSKYYRPLTTVVRVLATTLPDDVRKRVDRYDWRAPLEKETKPSPEAA